MCAAYYNENNRFAAQWLRNLISAGLIGSGFGMSPQVHNKFSAVNSCSQVHEIILA